MSVRPHPHDVQRVRSWPIDSRDPPQANLDEMRRSAEMPLTHPGRSLDQRFKWTLSSVVVVVEVGGCRRAGRVAAGCTIKITSNVH